jgi:endo-1,4-beta-xylanase
MERRDFLIKALRTTYGIAIAAGSPLAEAIVSPVQAKSAADFKKGRIIPFGAAVRDDALSLDIDYRDALSGYCNQLVGEGGLKWIDLRPTRDIFDFDQPDRLLAFADKYGLQMRGHTLAWYGAMPDWTNQISTAKEAQGELRRHIAKVVGRYGGRIKSWDVINEAIADDPAKPTDLRPSVWQERMGPDYIAIALRAAAAADPSAQLVINDYDIEFVGDRYRRRREALLHLIRSLKDKDVPLHAVGLQGHLHAELEIDKEGVSSFVAEMKAMGLKVLVTELDVIDDQLPGPVAVRDAVAAARANDFLQAIAASDRPDALLTWGITDKYTWVPMWFKRADGLPNRPLPLDDSYQPKPLMTVIQQFVGGQTL